jgi:hypothetical protein
VRRKLEADTVSIVPIVPPGAGAERAFDFPLPDPNPAGNACPAAVDAAADVDAATDAGVVEADVATPTVDPMSAATRAEEAIHRFRLLCSHRGSFDRRVGSSGVTPSMPLDSNSFITALLSNWRITRVPVFDIETLNVVWRTSKKSPHFAERQKT